LSVPPSDGGQNGAGRFAGFRPGRRVWAVGSVNGDAARLAALHDALRGGRFEPDDRIVYLGNVLGPSGAVSETLAELLDFRCAVLARPGGMACDVAFLRGSQEEMWQKLLQLQFATNPGEVLQWMLRQGLGPTIAAYGADPEQGLAAARQGALALTRWTGLLRQAVNAAPGHRAFFSGLRRAALVEGGVVLFVHAGLDPALPLEAQGDRFWWHETGFHGIAEPYGAFRRIVRGFSRHHDGLVEGPFTVSLDGGAGLGGQLVAACVDVTDGRVLDALAV
jgi:serine/threonine protein phosphatase 1